MRRAIAAFPLQGRDGSIQSFIARIGEIIVLSDQRITAAGFWQLAATMPLALVAVFCIVGAANASASDDAASFRRDAVKQLQASESPRDWALASQLLDSGPEDQAILRERASMLQKAAQAAPHDRLVQSMWSNLPIQSGAAKRYAGHWSALARFDPLNAVAWVAVIDHASRTRNSRAIDAGLEHMADALGYNEHFGQAVGAWRDVFRRFPPAASSELPRYGKGQADSAGVFDMAYDEAVVSVTPPVQSLVDACSKSKHPHVRTRRFGTCGKIARLMMGRAQTLSGRLDGVAVLRASHAGTPADMTMVRAVTWQGEQNAKVIAAMQANPYAKQNYLDLVQRTDSEILAIQYELRMARIALTPPDDWKQTVNGKLIEPLDDVSGAVN